MVVHSMAVVWYMHGVVCMFGGGWLLVCVGGWLLVCVGGCWCA